MENLQKQFSIISENDYQCKECGAKNNKKENIQVNYVLLINKIKEKNVENDKKEKKFSF